MFSHSRPLPPRPAFGKRVHSVIAGTVANDNHEPAAPLSREEPAIIFAIDAASNGKSAEQIAMGVQQFRIWAASRGLPYRQLIGRYDGKDEVVFLTSLHHFHTFSIGLRWCCGQKSFLVLSALTSESGYRHARLFVWDKKGLGILEEEVDLGDWICISAEEASRRTAWTLDEDALSILGCKGDAAKIYWTGRLTPLVR